MVVVRFGEPKYTGAAEKATQFILNKMITDNERLLHCYRDGQASVPAYLDDDAFLVYAMLERYETTFKESYLEWALSLSRDLIEHT